MGALMRWVIMLVLVAIVVFLFASLINKVVTSRKELLMSHNFLIENTNMQRRCGLIKDVRLEDGGSGLSFTHKTVKGRYRFNVTGSESNGLFEVWWETVREGTNFIVTEIRELHGSDDYLKIWP